MRKVFAKHLPYTDGHVGKVTADMEVFGSPTIRVMKFDRKLFALEGSHRLAIAHEKDIVPKLVIQEEDESLIPDGHWKKVAKTLPKYLFKECLVLDLNVFKGKKYG